MKKLNIIAGFVFTTIFFASCENNEVMPKDNYANATAQTVDFQEPEFAIQKRPSAIALENAIIPTGTEVISAVENKQEQ
jgi:PBP1b-binding outer membrane lipoprotein LpoB